MAAGFVDQDWRENRKLILSGMERLTQRLDDLTDCVQQGMAELRTEIAVIKESIGVQAITRDEIEAMVSSVSRKKNGGAQELTRDEIRRIAEETLKHKNGNAENGALLWEPWKYIILGAAIAAAGGGIDKLVSLIL